MVLQKYQRFEKLNFEKKYDRNYDFGEFPEKKLLFMPAPAFHDL